MRFRGLFAVLFLILIFSAFVARIFFGADVTDEGFYGAVPYSFSRGNLPFVDEFYLQQLGGYLVTPLVFLYTKFIGSSAGIILFLRASYCLATFLVLLFCIRVIKLRTEKFVNFVFILPTIFFVPFSVYHFSYNTLAILFMNLAVWSVLLFDKKADYSSAFFISFFVGLSGLVYPPLLSLFVVLLGYAFFLDSIRRIVFIRGILLGGMCSLAIFSPALVNVDALIEAFKFQAGHGVQGGGISKVLLLVREMKTYLVIFLCGIAAAFTYSRSERPYLIVLMITLVVVFFLAVNQTFSAHYFGLAIGFFVLPLWLLPSTIKLSSSGDVLVVGMIIACAFLTAWTSSNGLIASSAFGVLLGAVTLFILFKDRPIAHLCGVFMAVVVVGFQYKYVYRDDQFSDLTVRVEDGPYLGIFTTSEKNNFFKMVKQDLAALPAQYETLVAFDSFPAAYLFSDLKPMTYAVWMPPAKVYTGKRYKYIDYYNTKGGIPDVILYTKKIRISSREFLDTFVENDELLMALRTKGEYELFLSRNEYDIYTKK